MSKLLAQLRTVLSETTATTSFSYAPGRRRRKKSAIDRLARCSATAPELGEAASLWLKTRAKIEMMGMGNHPLYVKATTMLDVGPLTEDSAYAAHKLLTPIFEQAEAILMGDEFAPLHKKFVGALAKEFKVEVQYFESIAEGVYVFIDTEDTAILARDLAAVRHFAQKHGYLLIKKGTTDETSCVDHARWIFIKDQHLPT